MSLSPASSVSAGAAGLTSIFDSTLGAAAASIDTGAGGVTSGFTSLLVYMLVRTTEVAATSTVLIRVNGNSGGNYDQNRTRNLNTTVAGTTPIGGTSWIVDSASANSLAAVFTPITLHLPFYTATTALKTCLIQAGAGGDAATEMFNEVLVGTFRSAGAITQISVTAGSGNLDTGSRMQVVGVL